MTTSHDEETRRKERELYMKWTRGNKDAANFIEQFFYLCHLWDDLVDGDKKRSVEEINMAFWAALVLIPENPFYRQNWADLQPIIVAAINDWHTANALEEAPEGRDIAYTLRCSIITIISHCAYLCGGYHWLREVGPEIRRIGQRETLQEYKEGFTNA
jgi:hypothetical protein